MHLGQCMRHLFQLKSYFMIDKKKKIAFLITGLGVGGAEMVVRDLALGISTMAFEPIVISLTSRGVVGAHIEQGGVRVIALGDKGMKNPITLVRRFVQLLKKEQVDIVHTHLFAADMVGRIAARLAHVPVVISTLHNVMFGGRVREMILAATKGLVTSCVAVAEVVRVYALRRGISGSSTTSVIYNGVETTQLAVGGREKIRQQYGIMPDERVVISVGRLIPQKGFRYLIEAVKELSTAGIPLRLLIVGEGKERSMLEEYARSLPEGVVICTGTVSNVADYLAAADIFVMASLWEGFSLALVEAGAAGKIVVATAVGIAPELITPYNGFIVEPGNARVLAVAVRQALTLSPEEKQKMGQELQSAVRAQCSRETMIRTYEQLYERTTDTAQTLD